MEEQWYGWIPLLTAEIAFENSILNLINQRTITIINDKEKIKLLYDLLPPSDNLKTLSISDDIKYFEFSKKFRDPPEENSTVVIFVDKEYKIIRVLIFNSRHELRSITICEIDRKGIVKIFPSYRFQLKLKLDLNIVRDTYIAIRDIYHQHTHHKCGQKHGDILLPPLLAESRAEAIKKINDTFQRKIIKYHKMIKETSLEKKLDVSSDVIKEAKGEMTYAISFIELFKGEINNYNEYHFSYLNAIRAIDILARDIELHYTSYNDKKTTAMTCAILFVTFIIGIDAICGIINI